MTEHEEIWLPLVDEPIGGIVAQIQADDPEIERLVGSPRRILAFKTFAYIRAGVKLGELLVETRSAARTTARRPGSSCSSRPRQPGCDRAGGAGGRRGDRGRPALRRRRAAGAGRGSPGALSRVRPETRDLAITRVVPDNRIMGAVRFRLLALFLLACGLASIGASTGTTAKAPVVSAGAYAVQVNIPGQPGASAGGTPHRASHDCRRRHFSYPADGSAARTGALSSSAYAEGTTAQGRERRSRHLALQRRDHRRQRGRQGKGIFDRVRRRRIRRDEPRSPRPGSDAGAESALSTRRLGLRDHPGVDGRGAGCG